LCGGLPLVNFLFKDGELLGTIRCADKHCSNRTVQTNWFDVKQEWNARTGPARTDTS
jgi:hypothetical protein